MSVVILDAGPIGVLTRRGGVEEVDACRRWLRELSGRQVRVIVPEIADYEIRRELLRSGKTAGIARLDQLTSALEYLELTTRAMRRAADLRAEARRRGRPTADRHALDGDVILAGQALTAFGDESVVATTNVGHLTQFVSAALWTEVRV